MITTIAQMVKLQVHFRWWSKEQHYQERRKMVGNSLGVVTGSAIGCDLDGG